MPAREFETMYPQQTQAYTDFMRRIEGMRRAELARVVRWIIDDVFGTNGLDEGPRALADDTEKFSGDICAEIITTLECSDLLPDEHCG